MESEISEGPFFCVGSNFCSENDTKLSKFLVNLPSPESENPLQKKGLYNKALLKETNG